MAVTNNDLCRIAINLKTKNNSLIKKIPTNCHL